MHGKKRRIRLGRRAAELLDIPEETTTGSLKLVLYGREKCVVENHKGIFECGETIIRLRTPEGIIRIEGERMTLLEISSDRAIISGAIYSASYEK